MKLATYRTVTARSGSASSTNDVVIDVVSLDPRLPATMIDLLRAGANGMDGVRRALAGKGRRTQLAEVTLSAPVPKPSKYLALGATTPSTSKSLRNRIRAP